MTQVAFAVDGYELFGIGPIQKGMGGAGAAAPKDATWVLLNPASIVELDRRIDLGLEIISFEQTARPRGLPPIVNIGARKLSDRTDQLVPSFGMIWPLRRGVLGVGLYAAAGQRLAYGRPRSALALLSNGDRSLDYQVIKFPVAYAYRFESGWALGAAVVPVLSRLRTDSLTLALRPARGDNKWDDAGGIGFELGMYRAWEKWGIGASYTSPTWVGEFDRYHKDLGRQTLDLPQSFRVGFASRPIPKVELVFDYKWIDWSGVSFLGRKPLQSGLGWRDQHLLKGGASWRINDAWTIRGGASWGRSPVDDEVVFVNSLSPAVSELHGAVGFSYRMNDRSSFHVAYSRAFPEERKDSGRGGLVSLLGRGSRIALEEESLSVQYSMSF